MHGTQVKGKLLCLEYDQIEPFVQDVRQCFVNAKLYNPSTNHVHKVSNSSQPV